MYDSVLVEQIGRVSRITLNRPDKLNAMNLTLQEELVHAAKSAEADSNTHALIIRGAGRAFSAGYDVTPTDDRRSAMSRIRSDIIRLQEVAERWRTIWNLRIPTVAQVHGYCVAGGTDLALHCDMIIAADDARIGFPAVRAMGAPPTQMWIYSVGPQWAKRLLLTGDLIDGPTAKSIGFAVESVPPDQLDETALRLASRMALIGKDLLAANKQIVNRGIELMGRSLLQQMAAENDAIAHLAPEAVEFYRIANEQGLRAALDWRDEPFRD